jgi:hypothetical protein
VKRGIVEGFCNAVTFVDIAYQNQDEKQYANVTANDYADQRLVKHYKMRSFRIMSFRQYCISWDFFPFTKRDKPANASLSIRFQLCCK